MKIRIRGNSVRCRLTQSEVARLWAGGRVEESTDFFSQIFVYAIEIVDNKPFSADFAGGKITLYMSKAMIDELHDTARVGFDGRVGTVALLVEKDFACIDNTEEDQSDNYPNPHQVC